MIDISGAISLPDGAHLFMSQAASQVSPLAPSLIDDNTSSESHPRLQDNFHHHHQNNHQHHHNHQQHHNHHHHHHDHHNHEALADNSSSSSLSSSSSSSSSLPSSLASSSASLPSSRLVFDKSIANSDLASGQQEATDTNQPTSILEYVHFNLVREMIAQHLPELILVCVIIIYLVYYFSLISRKPKLIGNKRSKFVSFIRSNLHDTLERRFNPLIYFWGTNPQTALFGYLQGQTSDHEVPRAKFKRQFLHVNDAQYLASNVDLSQHYLQAAPATATTLTTKITKSRKSTTTKNSNKIRPYKLVQLDANNLIINDQSDQQQQHDHQHHQELAGLLDQNIRSALNNIIGSLHANDRQKQEEKTIEDLNIEDDRPNNKSDCGSNSSAGSSSDSGVFGTNSCSNSSSSSSSSSGSSLTIDITTSTTSAPSPATSDDQQNHRSCSCSALYDSNIHQYLEPLGNSANTTTTPTTKSTTTNTNTSSTATNENVTYTREQLEYGQCALDWFQDSHRHYHRNKLIALISAGMTTGSDKKYVTDTVQTLDRLGYEVCVFIRRGVGGLKLSSNRFFSPSKWRDFEAAVLSVRKQRPGARLVGIGFSFGSIELCRYLSMSGSNSLIDAALLISCPFDPEAGGRNMRKRALNRKIDAYLAKNLGKQLYQALGINDQSSPATTTTTIEATISTTTTSGDMATTNNIRQQQQQQQQQLCNLNGSIINLAALPKIKSLVDFEDNYNRVIQNYPNSEAYAADSRLNEHLANIKTPTLCLSSEDDFMAPVKLLPIKQIEANKNLCMVLTKRGGHMAFIDGLIWPKKPYFAQRIISKYMLAFKKSVLTQEYATNPNSKVQTSQQQQHEQQQQQQQQQQQKSHLPTRTRTSPETRTVIIKTTSVNNSNQITMPQVDPSSSSSSSPPPPPPQESRLNGLVNSSKNNHRLLQIFDGRTI